MQNYWDKWIKSPSFLRSLLVIITWVIFSAYIWYWLFQILVRIGFLEMSNLGLLGLVVVPLLLLFVVFVILLTTILWWRIKISGTKKFLLLLIPFILSAYFFPEYSRTHHKIFPSKYWLRYPETYTECVEAGGFHYWYVVTKSQKCVFYRGRGAELEFTK